MGIFDIAHIGLHDMFIGSHSQIPLKYETVVGTTSDTADLFQVEFQTSDWSWGHKNVDRLIWVLDIPYVSFGRHFVRHLLKSLNGITYSDF